MYLAGEVLIKNSFFNSVRGKATSMFSHVAL